MITDNAWRYYATVIRVVDGDTVELSLDLGFKITMRGSFRLLGLNAREKSEPGGKEAKAHLTELLPEGSKVLAGSVKLDKYGGRYDAVLYVGEKMLSLNDDLIETKWAAFWDGTGPRALPPWPRVTNKASGV